MLNYVHVWITNLVRLFMCFKKIFLICILMWYQSPSLHGIVWRWKFLTYYRFLNASTFWKFHDSNVLISNHKNIKLCPPPPQYFIICSFLLTGRKPIKQDFKSFEPHFPWFLHTIIPFAWCLCLRLLSKCTHRQH